ncbi:MAG: FMN-binding protein [Clostridia bacterium]|nr:FMN-binding protein [Clostridia bacterium]
MKIDIKGFDWKYYVKTGATLLIIAAVIATMLAVVNYFTKDRIAKNEFAAMKETIEEMFSDCESIKEVEREFTGNVTAAYYIYDSTKKIGTCVRVEPVGFKDKITVIVGVDTNGKCVGVEIISISDTPGVGTKVKDLTYLGGYVGLEAEGASKYDTIAGATISSAAVREGVKEALALDIFGEEILVPETTTGTPETTTGTPETTTGALETTTGAPETTTGAPETTTGEAPATNA